MPKDAFPLGVDFPRDGVEKVLTDRSPRGFGSPPAGYLDYDTEQIAVDPYHTLAITFC